jgi:thiamine-phosphate pyrophosphorylase
MPPAAPLLVVLDRPTCAAAGHALVPLAAALLEAGARFLWYRDHSGRGAGPVLADIVALVPLARAAGAELVVGDRADVAALAGAHGVHLPAHGLPAAAVRARLGLERVGRSCHTPEELVAAERDGASYVTLSPIFETMSAKAASRPPLGLEALRDACHGATLPIYALGGITPERARPCLDAGAAGVAVLGGIVGAREPIDAWRRYAEAVADTLARHGRRFGPEGAGR